MVELDKIKNGIKNLCADMEQAYRNLDNRKTSCEEEDKKIELIKAELLLMEQRKVSMIQSVRDEQQAAADGKKEYTEKKHKYRKLIEEEETALSVYKDRVQKEVDNYRIKEMSSVKSERDRIISETVIAKDELAKIRTEYTQTKRDLDSLINRIR